MNREVRNLARIKLVQPDEADDMVKKVYNDMEKVRGKGRVSNVFKAYANFPELLKANWEQMKAIMGSSTLSRKMKETLAVGLSIQNECSY